MLSFFDLNTNDLTALLQHKIQLRGAAALPIVQIIPLGGQLLSHIVLGKMCIRDSWSPIRNQLDECVRRCESVVQQKRIQADGALSALQKEYTELEYHLRQIKSQPEPVPPRRESVQAARLQLMLRGVPCAPLYEIIDFSPETSLGKNR